MIKLLHIDASDSYRSLLAAIAPAGSFAVTSSYAGVAEAIGDERGLAGCDMIILGGGADQAGAGVTALKAAAPTKPIVVLAERLSLDSLGATFEAGAMGYLVKAISHDALFESLMLVVLGEKVFPAQLADLLIEKTPHDLDPGLAERRRALTAKEFEVMQYVKLGYSNKQIARTLGIADITVRLHINNAFRKMNVRNRIQGALWMIEHEVELNSRKTMPKAG
ncbi:response regulator transcription factor [Skermanella mucosa]|uniref:LuxR C-terminal-related transcriptional regulator n=1 Tax=Skermanella mucosa TaxID=1789672 RepID=UPI00192B8A77|nr:response regulator transcription factor [Skermanella mucosa]UEM20061.1 response regulator transcription factor [Skermanella mucosa]